MQHIVFLILGLGNGAVFAALALALVVTYRSSGVVNFATGAIALYTAYTYAFLRLGKLLIPFPWLPTTVGLPFTPGLWASLLLALVVAMVMGAALYLLVFRPLRAAPAVAKAVASLGITVVLQAMLAQKVGTTPVNTPHIFPNRAVTIDHHNVNEQILWLAATIVALTLVLWLAYRFTRFGLATRAVAETEKGAVVTGLKPDRIALANWAISAVVAGIGGILIAPIAPIIPVTYTLYVVPALAATLVAGFVSLPIAVGAGLGIGAVNSELTFLQAQHNLKWLSASAAAALVPLALILGYLVFRGRPLPSRGALILQTLGRAPRPRSLAAPALASGVIGLVALLVTNGGHRGAVTTSLILGIVALSLVVVTGLAGQVSLAQLTLAGVGAFALNRLTFNMGVPFPWAPLLAAVFAMIVGVVVGLPALRIRGLPVAVVTLALAVAVDSFWFNSPYLTNNSNTTVTSPRLLGLNLAVGEGRSQNRLAFGVMCLIVLLVTGIGVACLRRSRLGAAMLAIRANERSAAAAGVDVARTKVLAFAIAAFIAGLGGALLAYQQTRANEPAFNPIFGLGLFASVYLAGITSLAGGVLAGLLASGGIVFTLITEHVKIGAWYDALTGVLLILTVVKNPEGIAAGFHVLADRLHARRSSVAERAAPLADPVVVDSVDTIPSDGAVVLAVEGVSVRFGGVVAVADVSFDVAEGQIVGLIGPNGAGKTTLLDAISGFTPSDGNVTFMGAPLNGLRPHERIRRGLGRTFQGIELYEDLTVAENIVVGEEAARRGGSHVPQIDTHGASNVEVLCHLLGLADVVERPAKELSQGQRQLVSVARALAGRPRVILLDEPASGLDSTESQWLGERLRRVRATGVTVLMIDHDMHLVLDVCDTIHVLDLGRLIASGTPADIKSNPVVAAAYLGDAHAGDVKV
jgi:ABC-type branched-subunit amino acid transport system ATPase component/branched-subunit amino acid ABC-type transport system permease component